MKKTFKNIFLTGIIATVPVGVTAYIIFIMIKMMDNLLRIIPPKFQPDNVLSFHIPGLGVIFTIVLIFMVGLVVKSFVGNKFIQLGEWILGKIPFISGVKSQSFKRVVLIEYPRKGIYSVAFVTGVSEGEVQAKTSQQNINLFIPTTPNPTSGFYIMIPESDVINLDMTVEEAFTLIISGGIISPPERDLYV